MKILIGVDESPYSDAAVQYVRDLPLPASAEVIVVSAVQVVVPAYAEGYIAGAGLGAVDRLLKEETRAHSNVVARAGMKLREKGLRIETRVLTGDPGEVLVRMARDEGADLIVVGSHGRSGIARLVLGSVASYVMTHARCSVLVVKAKA